jgi:AraC family L-rhamnose operon regulatory protein RhaS
MQRSKAKMENVNAGSGGTVRLEPTPHTSRVLHAPDELRIELPFELSLESLAYIGIVSQQTWHVTPHTHDHFELCYVAEGHGWFAIDALLYPVAEGDLFLTKAREMHHGAALGTTPFRLYYLGFHLRAIRSLEADFYRLGSARVVHDPHATIRRMYDDLFRELQGALPHGDVMVQGLFLQLLAATLRAYTRVTDHAQRSLSPAVKRVLDALHAHISVRHDSATLASLAHLSRSQLDRTFKEQLGTTLGNYLRTLLLERAKYLLREGKSVSAVADTLEFSSIHTFSIFFKRHTSVSPRTYQERGEDAENL